MLRQLPLTCSGHARPVVNLYFSDVTSDGLYYMLSASKGKSFCLLEVGLPFYFFVRMCANRISDGQPMVRQGDTGDWIGTFMGHKGAVWGCALNSDATKAATASADFTA